MIHYVYIDGKIYLQTVSLIDFSCNTFFSKGKFYRVKSQYTPFNWSKYALYVSNVKKINDDKIEVTFTDPIFTAVTSTFTLARGYVNYNYDDDDDHELSINDFVQDMSPVGWYVNTSMNEYSVIESLEHI